MFPLLLLLSAPPPVTLERIVDGRSREVAVVARVERGDAEGRTEARLVRGLVRRDVVLRVRLPKEGGVETHEVWLDDGPALRLERPRDQTRVTMATPASSVRYFEPDARTRSVLCAVSRLDGLDPALPEAAEEIDLLERAGVAITAAPGPLKVLRLLRPPAIDSPPTRRRQALPDDDARGTELRAAVLAALDRLP